MASNPKTLNAKTDHKSNGKVVHNPWSDLRRFTDARIGLGRAGISLPTSEMLAFQLSHAQARDAVGFALNINEMSCRLSDLNPAAPVLHLHSQADDRTTYLQRPDLGRKLNQSSRTTLASFMAGQKQHTESKYDLAIVVADGLSSLAVQQNTQPFISELLGQLGESQQLKLAPITLVEQGRVAIGDDIGELLNAQIVMVLIGERPGLSSPDSLGLYLTWAPKAGLSA